MKQIELLNKKNKLFRYLLLLLLEIDELPVDNRERELTIEEAKNNLEKIKLCIQNYK